MFSEDNDIKDGYWYVSGLYSGVKAEGVDGKDGADGKDGLNGTDGRIGFYDTVSDQFIFSATADDFIK